MDHVLEMYDQTVRNYPGGAMMEYLSKENIINKKFILNRCGAETAKLIEVVRCQRNSDRYMLKSQLKFWLKPIYRFFRDPTYRRELLLKELLWEEFNSLKIGRFRQGGEIHQWMYDRYSLSRLLIKSGFEDIANRTADESYVINWSTYNLDTEPDGSIYKPDSLYMEALKT